MLVCSQLKKPVALLACALFASALVSCATPGVGGFEFSTTEGRLPKTVVPTHYTIDLTPDLRTLELFGSAVIDIEVREPTAQVVLNALNITIHSAQLLGAPESRAETMVARIALDATAQTATLTFPRAIPVGPQRLRIDFVSRINSFARGLFFIDYPTAGGRKRMISSHLEPANARRIFPGWDEPAFKASFELAVTVPQRFMAVSNMPVAREDPAGPGLKRVAFAATPRMSSYLFVLAAGELERLEGKSESGDVSIGVVTTEGKRAQGRYALDSAIRLLEYFNDYFGVKYPLPKLDLIALPGGLGGAMENWGGITFNESLLLFRPASPPGFQRQIFSILAHEMAHLWFGDLVTMAWWDDLWLNEGFASWMQEKAAQHLHPEWEPWLNAHARKQSAMTEDARTTTRAIRQRVDDESEAMTVFDAITYSKGQAFIRLLENHLGEDAFRDGIREYMKRHAYSNATTQDLWRSLQAHTTSPVAALAEGYIEQEGVPLVIARSVCAGGAQRIVLRQERFTLNDASARPLRWQVPLAWGRPGDARAADLLLLQGEAEFAAGRCGDAVKINFGDTGYYRVQYDGAMNAALLEAFPRMAPDDRLNLIADNWALVEAGREPAARFFAMLDRLDPGDHRAVWDRVIRIFDRIDFLERGRPERDAFRAYARARLMPAFERLGWETQPGESLDAARLRPILIRNLGELGDETILAEAKRRFEAFVLDRASLRPGLQPAVVSLAGRVADGKTYNTLLDMARRSLTAEERSRYYLAIAGALDPALAHATLQLALGDELPVNTANGVIFQVAAAGEHTELAWNFVRENFDRLEARLGPVFRSSFAAGLMTNFTDPARIAELEKFAPAQETSGARRRAARTVAIIGTNAALRAGQLPAVDEWVRERMAARSK